MLIRAVALTAAISFVAAYSDRTHKFWDRDVSHQGLIERDAIDLSSFETVPHTVLSKRGNPPDCSDYFNSLFSRKGEIYGFSYKKIQAAIDNPGPSQKDLVPALQDLQKALVQVEAKFLQGINKRFDSNPKFRPFPLPASFADLDAKQNMVLARDAEAEAGFNDYDDLGEGLYRREDRNLFSREAFPEADPYDPRPPPEDRAQPPTSPKPNNNAKGLSQQQQTQCRTEAKRARVKCENTARDSNASDQRNNRGGIVRPEDNKQGFKRGTSNMDAKTFPGGHTRPADNKQDSTNNAWDSARGNDLTTVNPQDNQQNSPNNAGNQAWANDRTTASPSGSKYDASKDVQNKQRSLPTEKDSSHYGPKGYKRDVDENYLFSLYERELEEYEALFEPEMWF